jgi:hypothetical protein
MNESKSVYPLVWPNGWPKTEVLRRENSRFDTSLSVALTNLKKQVELLGGSKLVLSSNYTLGNDNPKDCGVVAYFTMEASEIAVPCDRWRRIQDNVHAIALTIEAMRGMERWGAKHMIKAMFSGFKQLPSSERPWWEVLGCDYESSPIFIKERYRVLSMAHHPDRGGTQEAMALINLAYEQAMKEKGL